MLKIKKNPGLMGCRLSLGTGKKGLSMFTISKKVPQIQNYLQTFAYDSPKQGMKRKMPPAVLMFCNILACSFQKDGRPITFFCWRIARGNNGK